MTRRVGPLGPSDYASAAASLIGEYLRTDEPGPLVRYLSSESRLPGPRANLELLEVFAGEMRRVREAAPSRLWQLSLGLSTAPDEFVAM